MAQDNEPFDVQCVFHNGSLILRISPLSREDSDRIAAALQPKVLEAIAEAVGPISYEEVPQPSVQ